MSDSESDDKIIYQTPVYQTPVVSATKYGGEYWGVRLVMGDRSVFSMKMDNIELCCEELSFSINNVDINDFNVNDALGKTLLLSKNNCKRENAYPRVEERNGSLPHIICVDLVFTDGTIWQLNAINIHNGYYTHEVYIQHFGDEEEVLTEL